MKVLFIPANWSKKVEFSSELINILKKISPITIFTSVNFLDQLDEMVSVLKNEGIEVNVVKAKRTKSVGQILGCDSYVDSFKAETSIEGNVLYVGDGNFHSNALLFSKIDSSSTIVTYDPKTKLSSILSSIDLKKNLLKIKSNLIKYTLSNSVGILVTSKSGQERLSDAIKLKSFLESKGKTAYLFLDDTFNFSKIEDFNFIDVWVNTACPRIVQDDAVNIIKPIINYVDAFDVSISLEKIEKTLKKFN